MPDDFRVSGEITVRRLLDEALLHLSREAPLLAGELALAVGRAAIRIELPKERFDVGVKDKGVETRAADGEVDVLARATPAAILAVIDGTRSLDDALLEEEIGL